MMLFDIDWFDVPDLIRILLDGAVTGEETGLGDIHQAHSCPALLVLITLCHTLLRFTVCVEISQYEEFIILEHQFIIDETEILRIRREGAICHGIHDTLDLIMRIVILPYTVRIFLLEVIDILDTQTEDLRVFFAYTL